MVIASDKRGWRAWKDSFQQEDWARKSYDIVNPQFYNLVPKFISTPINNNLKKTPFWKSFWFP